ncbi:MAG: hypothetical protein RR543_02250 [Erysipelotrichales bacterium]
MEKYYFNKEMNKDGFNELYLYKEEMNLNENDIVVLKGAYNNIDEAIKALENSDWYLGLNYRFIKGEA